MTTGDQAKYVGCIIENWDLFRLSKKRQFRRQAPETRKGFFPKMTELWMQLVNKLNCLLGIHMITILCEG